MKRYILVIDRVNENFNPKTHKVIAPWCFAGSENIYGNWEDLDFVDVLSVPDEVAEISVDLEALALDYIFDRASELNNKHKTEYGIEFWKILLQPYVLNLLTLTYSRYIELIEFINKNKDLNFICHINMKYENLHFLDFIDFYDKALLSSSFNSWVTSEILKKLSPKNIEIINIDNNSNDFHDVGNTLIKCSHNNKFMSNYRFMPVYRLNGMGVITYLLINLYLVMKRFTSDNNEKCQRNNSEFRIINREFSLFFKDIANRCNFLSLTSHFSDYNSVARKRRYYKGRPFIPPASAFQISEEQKFELAHAVENGEKIICFQHGYGYGIVRNFLLFAFMEYSNSVFLTWGWRKHGSYSGKFLPVSVPHLTQYEQLPRPKEKSGILLIGTSMMSTAYRFNSEPSSYGQVKYRKDKKRFLEALSQPTLEGKIIYREGLRLHNSFKDFEYLQRQFPFLIKETSAVLERGVRTTEIAVVDHPGTTIANILIMNHPLVLFWNKEVWPLCEQAQKELNFLSDAGIYHETPESAAQFINENRGKIEDWWNSSKTQRARKKWLSHYGKTSRSWLFDWISVISGHIKSENKRPKGV